MSRSLRVHLTVGLAVVTAVLLAVATVGAVQLRSDGRQGAAETPMAAGSSGEPAAGPVPTTLPSDAGTGTGPGTASAADGALAPAAAASSAAPFPGTPPVPPVVPVPAMGLPPVPGPPLDLPPLFAAQRTFTISPTAGPANGVVTASGTGCTGPSAQASIRVDDPNGLPYGADAGSASAGGAWSFPFSISASAVPGVHTVTADCRSGAQVLFVYPPQPFTVGG